MSLVETLVDPDNLLTGFIAVISFATIVTLAAPMMGKTNIDSRMKSVATLPDSTPSPVLSDPAGVRRVLTETIQQARTGKLDHRIAAVVIQGVVAAVKLAELEVAAQIGDLERRFRLRRA